MPSHLERPVPPHHRLGAIGRRRWCPLERGLPRVDGLYDVQAPGVTGFLSTHPQVEPLLVPLYQHVTGYFGAEARASLKLSSPEEAGDPERLLVLVTASFSPRAAREALTKFDEEWWLEADTSDGLVCVDVRFS